MCPYCGNTTWNNSWGAGNARCCACRKEFNVVSVSPPQAAAIPEDVRRRYAEVNRGFLQPGVKFMKEYGSVPADAWAYSPLVARIDEVFGEYTINPEKTQSLVSSDELARWMGVEQEIE